MSDTDTMILEKTATIVSAYLGRNDMPPEALSPFIREVYQTLAAPGSQIVASNGHAMTRNGTTTPQSAAHLDQPAHPSWPRQAQTHLTPAVDPKASVYPEYIICLNDGKKLKMLKRHLATSFKLTPDEYREMWGLGPEYPMVAPRYAAKRSELAKRNGLGRASKAATRRATN